MSKVKNTQMENSSVNYSLGKLMIRAGMNVEVGINLYMHREECSLKKKS
jgi:hypothetical protein